MLIPGVIKKRMCNIDKSAYLAILGRLGQRRRNCTVQEPYSPYYWKP